MASPERGRQPRANPAPSPVHSPPPDSWEITPLTIEPVLGRLLGGGGALPQEDLTLWRPWEAWSGRKEARACLPVSEIKALLGM